MSDLAALFQEYKDYYNVRASRYEGDPDYRRSYEAEKAMADAMNSCNELAEFKDKLGNKNELSGVARVLDTHEMEDKHFTELKEHVRAAGPQRVVQRCEGMQNVTEAVTAVQEEMNKNSVEISMDEAHREFADWNKYEEYEVGSRAIVPSNYESEVRGYAERQKKELAEGYDFSQKYLRDFDPEWTLNPDLCISEDRHKKYLPYPEESIQKRRAQCKEWTGR